MLSIILEEGGGEDRLYQYIKALKRKKICSEYFSKYAPKVSPITEEKNLTNLQTLREKKYFLQVLDKYAKQA